MNNKEREKELNNKIKEIERLNKDILDMYQRNNRNLLELSNGLHGSLQGILEFTKNKPIGSDLYNIHIFAGEGLETYRKVKQIVVSTQLKWCVQLQKQKI